MSDDFSTEDFIWQLKNSKEPDERLYAAFKLGRDREAIVIEPLIEASDDLDDTVRVRVAEALGTRTEGEVVPTLIKLIQDDDPIVRRTAADSLGNVADMRGVSPLCMALKDEDDTVRSHAAEALGKIQADDSAESLVDAFLHDEDYNVRYFAKQSLGNVGKAAVTAILDTIEDTDDPVLLVEICEILGNLADARCKPALKSLETHEDDSISEMASWALKRIWD
jgi:HEAT repeat protein